MSHTMVFVERQLGNKPLPKGYASEINGKDLRKQYRKLFNVTGPAIQLHYVELEGYKPIGSFEAFRNKSRNFSKTRWYYAITEKEEFLQIYSSQYSNLNVIEHKSIYDFFTFIGYNYKTKKFEDQNVAITAS